MIEKVAKIHFDSVGESSSSIEVRARNHKYCGVGTLKLNKRGIECKVV